MKTFFSGLESFRKPKGLLMLSLLCSPGGLTLSEQFNFLHLTQNSGFVKALDSKQQEPAVGSPPMSLLSAHLKLSLLPPCVNYTNHLAFSNVF